MRRVLILLFSTTTVLPTARSAPIPVPLTATQRAIFHGSPEDPRAQRLDGIDKRLTGAHYLAGDEWHMDVFYKHLRKVRGGGYVGVGTDQAYLLMGWTRPELAWLIDYDSWVHYIHRAHAVFITAK